MKESDGSTSKPRTRLTRQQQVIITLGVVCGLISVVMAIALLFMKAAG